MVNLDDFQRFKVISGSLDGVELQYVRCEECYKLAAVVKAPATLADMTEAAIKHYDSCPEA